MRGFLRLVNPPIFWAGLLSVGVLSAALLLLYFFLNSNVDESKRALVNVNLPPLKKGDLIFRQGLGLDSLAIQKAQNHPFSHLGIVVGLEPVLIAHATTNDEPARQDQVILSSLESFVAKSKQIAIKRYPLSIAEQEQVAKTAISMLGEKFELLAVGFSVESNATSDFGAVDSVVSNASATSLAHSSSLYCTTFVARAFASTYPLEVNFTNLSVPLLGGFYLLPKTLFESPQSELIFKSEVK